MNEALTEYVGRFLRVGEACVAMADEVAHLVIPPPGSPTEIAAACSRVLFGLGVDFAATHAIEGKVSQLQAFLNSVGPQLDNALRSVESRLSAALLAGGEPPEDIVYVGPEQVGAGRVSLAYAVRLGFPVTPEVQLALLNVADLPSDDPLAAIVPPADLYDGVFLVLGPAGRDLTMSAMAARPWYPKSLAIRLTLDAEKHRRWVRAEKEREREMREAGERAARSHLLPLQQGSLQARVVELEAQLAAAKQEAARKR